MVNNISLPDLVSRQLGANFFRQDQRRGSFLRLFLSLAEDYMLIDIYAFEHVLSAPCRVDK